MILPWAEILDITAAVDNGITAGADTAAGAADTAAIALDAIAAATAEIIFVDIGTAAAAAAGEAVALALDEVSVGADTTDVAVDGAAAGVDAAATPVDEAAAAEDVLANAADELAAEADATAAAADTEATTENEMVATADTKAVALSKDADLANKAADEANDSDTTVNQTSTGACALAAAADVSFTGELQTLQNHETTEQTQTLSIADQLDTGVRSLDLQGGQVNDNINLNAGQDFTGYTLQGALNEMTSFLQTEPTETIVVSLSNDAAPVNSSNSFNTDLLALLNSSDTAVPGATYNDFVYSSSNSALTPTLGDARGKIVFVPNVDNSWTPPAGLGWQPNEVDQNSHTITDPNTRWNYAENDNGANDNGLIPTDLGNPSTLYRNNTTQDFVPGMVDGSIAYSTSAVPVGLGDAVDGIAQQYFTSVQVSRTTGIVGMDDPTVVEDADTTANLGDGTTVDETLINAIINENTPPIIVSSDSDVPGAAGTLRDAILLANSEPGLHNIEFAPDLNGPTGNVIILQSDLPVVTNDLVVAGPVIVNTNGYQGFQLPTPDTHTVTENDAVASDSGPLTIASSTDTTPVYLDTSGITITTLAPLLVNPVNITYGTALSNSQLHGIAMATSGNTLVTIPGTFTFTSAGATVLNAGLGQTEAVTFTPNDIASYASESTTVIVNVAKAVPVIASIAPVSMAYGTALANSQLSGTATVGQNTLPGTFDYTDAGSVPHAGDGQSEVVTFIPSDAADYASVFSTVTVNVAQVAPVVTVNAVSIAPGAELDNNQLGGTAISTVNGSTVSVPGLFTYTADAGVVLDAGNGQTENVTFTPSDATDFETVATSVTVNVAQSSPVASSVTVNPVDITYGAALANSQLSGDAMYPIGGTPTLIPGAFTFTTPGPVLDAGAGQSEAVTFTPTDAANYAQVALTATVNVAQATPTIASVNPVNIPFGTALANTQLSGNANYMVNGSTVTVPGTFSYTSAAGSEPSAGSGQSEAVTFTPTDATDYATASSTVTVNVAQATPTVTSVNAVSITYGTALANTQLSGTATYTLNGTTFAVPGSFTYTSAAGTVLSAGNGQSATVTFTPTDTADYTTASSTVTVNVAQAMPTVTVTDAGGPVSGSLFPASGTVTGVDGANLGTPTFTYFAATDVNFTNPLPGAPSALGRYVVVGSYAASGNYAAGAAVAGFPIYTPPPPLDPTITSAAQPATAPLGTSIADKVTVTGSNPTGVVTFKLYNNATATAPALFTDTEPLVGGIATSKGYTTSAAALGADYWVATYSGDAANNPVTTVASANPVTVNGSLVVSSTGDGPTAAGNTLRDAVAYANVLGAGTHAITFDPTVFATSQTITLVSPLTLSDASGATIITGPSTGVTLSGGNSISLFNVKAGVTATLSDLSLIDGKSSIGGAIVDQGTLTITDSTLSSNTSTGVGGAIMVTGSLTIVNSTLASNRAAGSGGAIENVGSLTVLDSTLSANQAGTAGSGSGGAIDNSGAGYILTIGDSIVAGNSATSAPNISNSITSQGNNLIGATDGSSGWVSSDLTGSVALPLNPMLAPLGNNGGPTPTMALLSTSPAIGAGAPINGVATDQRGLGRPASSPDMGAYQSEAVVTVTDAGGKFNGSPFPATSASATGTFGLHDTNLADFTFSYVGTGSTTYAASSTAPTSAGTYAVTATYRGDPTHASSSSLPTPFTISQGDVTIVITPYVVIYDGKAHTATGKATGIGGINLSADLTLTATTHTSAGTYTTDSWTFIDPTGHYTSESGVITDVISKAAATINVTPYDIAYDAKAHTAAGTATGVGGVNLAADLNLSGTTHTNAGTYATDTWTFIDPTGNYTSASGVITDVISKKAAATINFSNLNQTYTGKGEFATIATIPANLSVVITYSQSGSPVTTPISAGSYQVTATSTDPNYQGAASTTLVINKAKAVITITGAVALYNAHSHAATGTAAGVETPAAANLTSLLHLSYKNLATNAVSSSAPVTPGTYAVLAAFDGNANYISIPIYDTGKRIVISQNVPVFSDLSSPTIVFHSGSVTLSGNIKAGSLVPAGDVTITFDGVTELAPIASNGAFFATFDTKSLPVGMYNIGYAYAGSNGFAAAASQTELLRVDYRLSFSSATTAKHRAGSTIQVQFTLQDASGKDIVSTNSATAIGISTQATPNVLMPLPAGSSPGGKFTRNSAGDQFTLSLKTTGLAPGAYLLQLIISGDHVTHLLTVVLT